MANIWGIFPSSGFDAKESQPYTQYQRVQAQKCFMHALNLSAMPREAEPSNNEREFILEAVRQDTRLDGRALDAYRDIEISFGDEYGVADVRLGKTR